MQQNANFYSFGLNNRVENYTRFAQRRIITIFHGQGYCWIGPIKGRGVCNFEKLSGVLEKSMWSF